MRLTADPNLENSSRVTRCSGFLANHPCCFHAWPFQYFKSLLQAAGGDSRV